MPMARLYVNQANAHIVCDRELQQEFRQLIAQSLSMGDKRLDPDDDIDVRIMISEKGSRSKYDLTVDVEAMDTPERRQYFSVIARTIGLGTTQAFIGELTVNVWFKLVQAEYWSASES